MPVYSMLARRWRVLDVPNARSSHQQVTPRGGGIVFLSLWLIWLFWKQHSLPDFLLYPVVPPIVLLMGIGFLDDMRGLSFKWRLCVQWAAAGIFLFLLYRHTGESITLFSLPFWLSVPTLLVLLVWSTNLYNFMDGIDGITATEGLFIFLPMSIILMQYEAWPLILILFALSATLLGFLVWNWPKATLFMGDVGSTVLGFLVIAFALIAYHCYDCPIWYWIILYGVFWFDATLTLCRRAWHCQRIWEAHRSHAYQRLHQAGLSHQSILIWIIVLNLILVGIVSLSVYLRDFPPALSLTLTLGVLSLYYRKVGHLKQFS